MKRNLVMPKLGLTMTEGLVSEWCVKPGEAFEQDQTIFVVETEKAANDVTAEFPGVLVEIIHHAGSTVAVGETIGCWEDESKDDTKNKSEDIEKPHSVPSSAQTTLAPSMAPDAAINPALSNRTPGSGERMIATPLARRKAAELELDLRQIRGTGPNGRIKLCDLGLESRTQASAMRREKPDSIAATIAERMVKSAQEIPHFYLVREVNVGKLLYDREQLAERAGTRLSINAYVLAAVGRALLDEPSARRVWDQGELVHLADDVGMAVHTDRGLFAPVLRNTGSHPLPEIAENARALAQRAREGKLRASDSGGAAITVSNAGMFNVSYMGSIINPGEAMILSVGSVRELFRPDPDGKPELRREIGLVLTCDHRVLDGVSGLRFLARVVHYLEHPELLMRGIGER